MSTLTKSTGTVTLTGAVEKVTLPAAYGWVWIKNMSDADMFAGLSEGISAGADGVLTISAGDAGRIQMDGSCEFYLLGSGNALVVAQNYADCPFKAGVKGGGSDVDGKSSYTLTNAVDYPIMELNLYGKSVQDGTPSPDNPVDIVSVGDGGAINITSNNGGDISVSAAITSALPLCGIPVAEGGNYTDSSGQQWVCDELVYNTDGSGKVVKRTAKIVFNNNYAVNYAYDVSKAIIYNVDTNRIKGKVLCNVADYAIAKWDADVIGNCFWGGGNLRNIFVRVPVGLTNEEINNMDIKVIYQLAEPQEIPITAAEMSALRQLQTFNGITNISNDGGAEMSVNYCSNKMLSEYVVPITMGLQAQIDELKSAVLSLGGNV